MLRIGIRTALRFVGLAGMVVWAQNWLLGFPESTMWLSLRCVWAVGVASAGVRELGSRYGDPTLREWLIGAAQLGLAGGFVWSSVVLLLAPLFGPSDLAPFYLALLPALPVAWFLRDERQPKKAWKPWPTHWRQIVPAGLERDFALRFALGLAVLGGLQWMAFGLSEWAIGLAQAIGTLLVVLVWAERGLGSAPSSVAS